MQVSIAVGDIAHCAFEATIYFDELLTCKHKKVTKYKDNGWKTEDYVKKTLFSILKSLEGKCQSVAIECPFTPKFSMFYGTDLARRYVCEWVVEVVQKFETSSFTEIALICEAGEYKELKILAKEKLSCKVNV